VDVVAITGSAQHCSLERVTGAIEAAAGIGSYDEGFVLFVQRDSIAHCLPELEDDNAEPEDEVVPAEPVLQPPSGDWQASSRGMRLEFKNGVRWIHAELQKKDKSWVQVSKAFELGNRLSNDNGSFFQSGNDLRKDSIPSISIRVWNLLTEPLVIYFLREEGAARSNWQHKGELQPLAPGRPARYGEASAAIGASAGSALVISVRGRTVGQYSVTGEPQQHIFVQRGQGLSVEDNVHVVYASDVAPPPSAESAGAGPSADGAAPPAETSAGYKVGDTVDVIYAGDNKFYRGEVIEVDGGRGINVKYEAVAGYPTTCMVWVPRCDWLA
jgi:hypothetical protein